MTMFTRPVGLTEIPPGETRYVSNHDIGFDRMGGWWIREDALARGMRHGSVRIPVTRSPAGHVTLLADFESERIAGLLPPIDFAAAGWRQLRRPRKKTA